MRALMRRLFLRCRGGPVYGRQMGAGWQLVHDTDGDWAVHRDGDWEPIFEEEDR